MLFEKSADAKIIEALLKDAAVGAVITYDQISKAIGRDVRTFAMAALNTARRGVFKEFGIVFGVERRVGLKRLNDSEVVKTSEYDRLRVHRISRKTLDRLAKVNFETLDEASRKEHVIASTQFGVMAMFSHKNASNKIESKVDGKSKDIPIGETLKLFGG